MNVSRGKFLVPLVMKIVTLTSVLVIGVALILAIKNAELFSQISKDREEANAELYTSSKALEVEAILESYVEKLALIAAEKDATVPLTGDLFYFKLQSQDLSANLEKTALGLSPEALTELRHLVGSFKAEEAAIRSGNLFLASTGSSLKEPYLVMGTPVAKENGFVTHWAWGLFKLNRLQASFENKSNFKIYLVDGRGHVIVHPDEAKTLRATNLADTKIISALLKESVRQRQQYSLGTLYSSTKTAYGPMVIGEILESTIMAPAKLARETSYFILGLVLSVTFFLSFVFSQGLSKNLEKLTDFAHRIAQGDFTVEAAKEITSNDEVGLLANAFDEMTEGLRERDKIKGMFTKFHGTAVTEQLMNDEDIRKGKQCDAVVFFSDIRGFTDFSNERSPEEVVAMLNSYFEVMVAIITKHGGVVDKFVGDAIMAIWGAPTGTPDDARNALSACLEMRTALVEFNDRRIANGEVPIKMGMGLHAGSVVAGTVGSNTRLEYTVIGDTVNTASRIESATKAHGVDLLISEAVVKHIDDEFIVKSVGLTKLKGKTDPLRLASVLGRYDEDGVAQIIATPYSQYEPEVDAKSEKVA
jgi:adenylate cyclase